MATLPTLRPGAANTTGLPIGSPTPTIIANPGGATALSDNADGTFDGQNTNSSGAYQYGRELADMPSDFGTMATLSISLRYAWESAPSNTTWDSLQCRVMRSDGVTVLAGATSTESTSWKTVASSITTTTPTTSTASAWTYVDTTATKAVWDAAIVQVQWNRTRSKGGDSLGMRVYEGFITGTYNVGAVTQTGSFVADAIKKRNQTGSFVADAIKKRIGLAGSFVADAVARVPRSGSFTADAHVRVPQTGSFVADAVTARAQAGSVLADAIIEQAQAGSVLADAIVEGTIAGSFTADAYIPGEGLAAAIWVSPADTSTIGAYPVLVFTTPTGGTNPYHFNMQLDKVATFDGGDLRDLKTNVDVTGWEYFDGGGWQPLPATGMPIAYAGNDARYTVQVPLTTGTWYRRVRAGA